MKKGTNLANRNREESEKGAGVSRHWCFASAWYLRLIPNCRQCFPFSRRKKATKAGRKRHRNRKRSRSLWEQIQIPRWKRAYKMMLQTYRGGGTISETPKQSEETDTVLEESAAEQESSDIRTKESAVTQENTAAEESAVLQESTATEEGTVIEEGTSAARPRRAAARAAIVESGTDWTLDADGLLTIASDEGMSDSGNISNKRNVKSISIRRH